MVYQKINSCVQYTKKKVSAVRVKETAVQNTCQHILVCSECAHNNPFQERSSQSEINKIIIIWELKQKNCLFDVRQNISLILSPD